MLNSYKILENKLRKTQNNLSLKILFKFFQIKNFKFLLVFVLVLVVVDVDWRRSIKINYILNKN